MQSVKFTAGNGELYVQDSSFGNSFGTHDCLEANAYQPLTVALPTGTTAFGADFANYFSNNAVTITATVNGKAFTFQAPGSNTNNSAFAGFTSTAPITSLSFAGSDYGFTLDNVSFGKAVSPVPEVSTTISFGLLLTLGLGSMVVAVRRRKASAEV